MCDACGNVVVQDMRDSSARRMLYETEARWQRARRARSVAVGAAVGVVVLIVSFSVRIALDPDPDTAVPSAWPMLLAFGSATGISVWLDRTYGARRKFAHLDEYVDAPAD
jgi:hypothetical protein